MSSLQTFRLILVIFTSAIGGYATADSDTIPLSRIWAWNMPGTIDIRKVEPALLEKVSSEEQQRRASRSLISQTLRPLTKFPAAQSEPGFATKGIGIDALKNAHAVLASKEKPNKTFSPHDAVSLVFFSRLFGEYVHIKEIKRVANRVEIRYQFVPHIDTEETVNFALIPLGKLPPGKVDVDVVRLPQDKKFDLLSITPVSKEMESRVVCKSFQFVVECK